MAFSSHWHLGNISLGTIWSADVIVIPCMQRLHQFYQLEPKGVARGREQIKTDAAFACMVRNSYTMHAKAASVLSARAQGRSPRARADKN